MWIAWKTKKNQSRENGKRDSKGKTKAPQGGDSRRKRYRRSWAKKNELKEGKEKWKVIGNGGMKTGKGLKAGLKWGKSLGAGHRTLDTNTGTYYVEWAIWAACEGVFRAIAKARVIELQDLTVLELPTVVRTGLSLGPDVMTDLDRVFTILYFILMALTGTSGFLQLCKSSFYRPYIAQRGEDHFYRERCGYFLAPRAKSPFILWDEFLFGNIFNAMPAVNVSTCFKITDT